MNLINQKFNKLLVLEEAGRTKDGSILWKCQCDCGNICYAATKHLRNGHKKSCGCLQKEQASQFAASKVKNLIGQKFNQLTVIEKTNKRTKNGTVIWKCQCDCGNIHEVCTSDLKNNRVKSCGCLRAYDLTGQQFGELTVIERSEKKYPNNRAILWKCQCSCGNICYPSTNSLTSGHTQSCGCKNSKGENKIISILTEKNINFKKEYVFLDLLNNNQKNLRFDFAILNSNNQPIALIEFNGIQHYEISDYFGGEEYFIQLQTNDKLKNIYCQKNNIPLLTIPYYDYNKLNWDYLNIKLKELGANSFE